MTPELDVHPDVAYALSQGLPVIALESTLISHGLPWPHNFEAAREAEAVVRSAGAIPATIAVLAGRPTIGLAERDLRHLASSRSIRKASRRDLGVVIAQQADAGTTVAATMVLARMAGISLFATGGIGGVHPAEEGQPLDISADLIELGRTPVAVVCAGAKSILDLPATLEFLETQGVPVLGYATEDFPAFYLRSSGLPVSGKVQSSEEAACVLRAHWALGGAGIVIALPLAETQALNPSTYHQAMEEARRQARQAQISGAALTPFLLARLAEVTGGRTLAANRALLLANAKLAASIAVALAKEP